VFAFEPQLILKELSMIKIPRPKSLSLCISVTLLGLVLTTGVSANPDKKKKKNQPEAPAPAPAPVVHSTPAPPPPANGSLFNATAPSTGLVADFKPQGVGDLIFIDVVEDTSGSVAANASRSRDSGAIAGAAGLIGAIPNPGAATAASVATAMGQRKFEGKGSTDRNSLVKAHITAQVVEVMPNGDLRIEAHKMVNVNKEDERLSLSGIVRRRDITSDNFVSSAVIGDLQFTLNGKGVASADTQPGWLFRLIDKVSPF
jgi:flagellar L-ring protein precursor FlgH